MTLHEDHVNHVKNAIQIFKSNFLYLITKITEY
jgi:hypothetical protein